MDNVKEKMDIFFDKTAPSIVVDIAEYREGYRNIRKRGGRIRAFTEITAENVSYCKELMKIVDELRHLDGVRGGIAVSETEYMATTILQENTPLSQVIYSNVKEVVEQGQYIFDTLWKTGIPAEQRIKEIEDGVVPEIIQQINNPLELQSKVVDLLRSAKEEILVIFSTANAFHRQRRTGSIQILKEIKDSKQQEVKIKILTPKDDEIEEISKKEGNNSNFLFRFMEPLAKVSILIVDRKYSIIAELKDDTKKTIKDAIGFGTYTNSAPTVLTYAAIFDALWKQIELYEQLQIHDKMQKEFINVAAHELRTPIQPILGLIEFVKNEVKDERLKGLLEIVHRNSKRLKRLAEDILDVTRIESSSFEINKESFLIKDVILCIINNYQNISHGKNITFSHQVPDGLVIRGDKLRIHQVISNLVDNSIKFSSENGSILIVVEIKALDDIGWNKRENVVVVSIRDTGTGINSEVSDKLFTKFTTNSFQGIGLGLYLSKNIIEAHGGKIWAQNNTEGKGATFSFSLPLSDKSEIQ